jgi:hypothetical protein
VLLHRVGGQPFSCAHKALPGGTVISDFSTPRGGRRLRPPWAGRGRGCAQGPGGSQATGSLPYGTSRMAFLVITHKCACRPCTYSAYTGCHAGDLNIRRSRNDDRPRHIQSSLFFSCAAAVPSLPFAKVVIPSVRRSRFGVRMKPFRFRASTVAQHQIVGRHALCGFKPGRCRCRIAFSLVRSTPANGRSAQNGPLIAAPNGLDPTAEGAGATWWAGPSTWKPRIARRRYMAPPNTD